MIGRTFTQTHPRFPERSPPECTYFSSCRSTSTVISALGTGASSLVVFPNHSSLDRLLFKSDRALSFRRFHRHASFFPRGWLFSACLTFVRARRLSCFRHRPTHLLIFVLDLSCCGVRLHVSFWREGQAQEACPSSTSASVLSQRLFGDLLTNVVR